MFLSLHLTIYGCNDNPLTNTNGKTYKAVTERDFQGKNFKAEPGAVIVLNLEDKNSPPDTGWYDTDVIGIDIIPIRYTETAKHNFKIDKDSDFEMSLISDSSKQVLFELTKQNTEANITIPSGDYLMIITSLEDFKPDSLGSQIVFIQPDTEILSSANTDYDPVQLNTLLSTKTCVRCNLESADLHNANLRDADLNSSYLRGVNLSGAYLVNVNLSNAALWIANLSNAFLWHANLTSASFVNANLHGANFYRANSTQALFNNANLTGTNFRNAILNNANLSHANLTRAVLIDADLTNAKLINANLSNADLTNAKLGGVDFSNADLSTAKLINANLSNTNFTSANLTNANLSYTNLTNANFNYAKLINANISYANLTNANFCNADKTGIIRYGAIWSSAVHCLRY